MATESDDPFAPNSGAVLRPRGAGARLVHAMDSHAHETHTTGRWSQSPTMAASHELASISEFIEGGRNPILQAAAPLIAIASRLQSGITHADAQALRNRAMREIRLFDDRLRAAEVTPQNATVARYILCTFFDSAVLNTPWGSQSSWSGQSLLVVFHKERSGGEKFFQILDRITAEPARYIDLIELQYVCLALGYEGMYRIDEQGHARLEELQHNLFRTIRDTRQLRDEELSVHWRGVENQRNPLFRYVPWWIVASIGLAVLAVGFGIYQSRLTRAAEPMKAALVRPSVQINYSERPEPSEPTPSPQPERINRLKELLSAQEQAGLVSVEELDGKTIVTLRAVDLFRSASARVNEEHEPVLAAVADALNQVTGRVVITGHTDDLPIRSLRFADNFELSRERAVAVAEILRGRIDNFGRIEWVGAGSTQPRYEPVDTAENRARNRRVEIVHVPEET